MLLRSVKMQVSVLFHRKSTLLVLFGMFALVFANYGLNLYTNWGKDVLQLTHPMKLTLLSDDSVIGYYFMQFYPIMIPAAASFSYFQDKHSREILFIETRVGHRAYYLGKLLSVFLVSLVVFLLPLLVEALLNLVAFPVGAMGDPSNWNRFDYLYMFAVKNYLLSPLFIKAPYLYSLIFIFVFGLVSAVLSSFATAVSTLKFMRFQIFVFLPVYVLLYCVGLLGNFFEDVSTDYFHYLRLFTWGSNNGYLYLAFVILLALITLVIFHMQSKKDELL